MNPAPPIPVIPLEYAKPGNAARSRAWVITATVALVVSAIDVLVGWLLIPLVNAETVIVTAPILFAAGLILLVASWRLKLLVIALIGLAHCAICLLFTMLVNVRNWSPSEATTPFTIIAGVYLLGATVPATIIAWQRLRAIRTIPSDAGSARRSLPPGGPLAEDGP